MPLFSKAVPVGRNRQVVVAQALAHVAGNNGQTWQRNICATLEYGAIRGPRHQWQIGQQLAQRSLCRFWDPELP